jgi:hypothetical protein
MSRLVRWRLPEWAAGPEGVLMETIKDNAVSLAVTTLSLVLTAYLGYHIATGLTAPIL